MTRKKLPYLNLFTGDHIRDTRILSLDARAIWMDLLCLMHDSDRRGYLVRNDQPYSVEELARFCTTSAATVTLAIQELINSGVASCIGTQQVLISRRMVRDEQKRRKCVAAGKKGGNPTLKGGVKGTLKPPLVVVVGSTPDSSLDPPKEEEKKRGRKKPRGGAGGAGFAELWDTYPHKKNVGGAENAFAKIAPGPELLAKMIAAIRRQIAEKAALAVAGAFVESWPHLATWLNNRRWEDGAEVIPPPTARGEGGSTNGTGNGHSRGGERISRISADPSKYAGKMQTIGQAPASPGTPSILGSEQAAQPGHDRRAASPDDQPANSW